MYNIWENRQCGSDVNGWFGQPLHLQREGNNEATSYSCIAEVITDETHHGQQEEKIFSVIEANFWCSQSDAVPSGVSGRVPEQMHTANRTPKYATAKPMKQPSLCQGWLSVPMILNHKPYLDCNTVMRGWGGGQTVYRVCQKQCCLRLQIVLTICQDLIQISPVLWKSIPPTEPQTVVYFICLSAIRSFHWSTVRHPDWRVLFFTC